MRKLLMWKAQAAELVGASVVCTRYDNNKPVKITDYIREPHDKDCQINLEIRSAAVFGPWRGPRERRSTRELATLT